MNQDKLFTLIAGLLLLVIDIKLFFNKMIFLPFLVLIALVIASPYLIKFFKKQFRDKELERHFPDFVRNLVSAIKSGMPVPKAIMHIAESDYGALTPYVKKLSYQIEWGIPIHKAMHTFSKSTNNLVIKRAISTVIEAEKSGGNIEDVLESITKSVIKIKQIKEKRKSKIQSQIAQNYIIFAFFLGIMIVIQNLVIPTMLQIQGSEGSSGLIQVQLGTLMKTVQISLTSPKSFIFSIFDYLVTLKGILLSLSLIQGFFMGIVMGKLAEDDYKAGLKHSLVLMIAAFIIITFGQGFVG